MRIYNGKNSQVDIPITNTMRITIAPHSVSKDFLPNDEFLTIVPTAYTDKDIALIVGGPYEINMCAKAPAAAPLVVQSLDEAIEHISKYSTGHSECIVTENEAAAEEFLKRIDSAAVYHNVSTRFTDGGEFGFGAEIGISTQKLHARGPLGLPQLTSFKYIVCGNGQIR